MNFFKRATTSILRRPGKTIILLLLVFILGTVIAGAISVRGAIDNTDANLRRNMQPILSITHDWEAWEEHPDVIAWNEVTEDWTEEDWERFHENPEAFEDQLPDQPSQLTPEYIRAIGELEQVRFFDYVLSDWVQTLNLNNYEGDIDGGWQPGEWDLRGFTVRGTSSENIVQIDAGVIELVQGRQFTQSELTPGSERTAVIVSRAFADHNDLSEGSVFTLSRFVFFPDESGEGVTWCDDGAACFTEERLYEEIYLEFEIVGLFDVPEDPDADYNNQDWERISQLNTIYVPNWAIEDISRRQMMAEVAVWEATDVERPEWVWLPDLNDDEEVANRLRVLPVFLLEDPDDVEDFKEAAMELLPSEFFRFEERSGGFDNISSSMDSMQTIANWILIAAVIATLLILSLLITLFLRDRRYEMGVYLALGEKKGKIISQILLEVVVTSFIAITLSVFAGHLISGQVSHNMLINQLQAELEADESGNMMVWEWDIFDEIGIPTTEMSVDDMMAQFDISLGLETIGLFYAVGLGAVIISSLVPVVYIVTLNPKKVLL